MFVTSSAKTKNKSWYEKNISLFENWAKVFSLDKILSKCSFVLYYFTWGTHIPKRFPWDWCTWRYTKGQLNSEWIYEVIVSPKIQTKNYKNFCPSIQTRIVALFFSNFLVSVGSFFWLRSWFVWQGRIPCNFRFAFWEKQWPHKFILNLTDLYKKNYSVFL